MKLRWVRVENVGIIRELQVDCGGKVIIIRGANATGKTTFLRAILVVFEGGSHPEMVGPYAERAVVELQFTNGWRFVREWTKKSYTLRGWSDDGGKIDSPADTLKALFDSKLSVKPSDLIDCKPAERVAFLHKALPLRFSAAELAAATGEDLERFSDGVTVEALDKLREGRYEQRTVKNVEVDRLVKSRDTLAKHLPDRDPLRLRWIDTAPGLDGLEVPMPPAADPFALVEQLQRDSAGARENLENVLRKLRLKYQESIDEVNTAEQAELQAVRDKYAGVRQGLEDVYYTETAAKRKPLDEQIQQLAGELAAAMELARLEAGFEGTRKSLRSMDAEIDRVKAEASRLDAAVKGLDELKRRKLDSADWIPGLETRGGQIFVNGLNFDTQLNTAKQYLVSTQLAALTLRDFPFLVLDNAEAMDEQNLAEYIAGLSAAGIQAAIAFVEDCGPLTVGVPAE